MAGIAVFLVVAYDAAGHIVMARQPHWPPGFWGLIAGFVEDGETAEQAAVREVREETGLEVAVDCPSDAPGRRG